MAGGWTDGPAVGSSRNMGEHWDSVSAHSQPKGIVRDSLTVCGQFSYGTGVTWELAS